MFDNETQELNEDAIAPGVGEDGGGSLLVMLQGGEAPHPETADNFNSDNFGADIVGVYQKNLGDPTDEVVRGENVVTAILADANFLGNIAKDHDQKAGLPEGTTRQKLVDSIVNAYSAFS